MNSELFQGMNYVYEVYKELSFSKAAKNLYISQPSLSNTVKRIENLLGTKLFDRSTNPISLTEAGKEYIKCCEIIYAVQNDFENYINEKNELRKGDLTIGGTTFYTSYILPPLVAKFKDKFPNININLVEGSTPKLQALLEDGSLDLLIDNLNLNEKVYNKTLCCKEQLLLVVPKSFDVNQRLKNFVFTAEDIKANKHIVSSEIISLKEFKDEPFLLLPLGNDSRSRANVMFQKAKVNPIIKLEPNQQISAYNFSCHDLGISFIGDKLVQSVANDDAVVYYKLDPSDALRDVNIFYKKNKFMRKSTEEFLKLLQENKI